jgi:CRISPR-associated protein Cmr5
MAHKLPILIHASGLAQALAFVSSRGKSKGPKKLLEDLSQTVLGQSAEAFCERSRGDAREGSLRDYLYLTEQTLAALLWYKRYAQSILNVEAGDDADEDEAEQEARA